MSWLMSHVMTHVSCHDSCLMYHDITTYDNKCLHSVYDVSCHDSCLMSWLMSHVMTHVSCHDSCLMYHATSQQRMTSRHHSVFILYIWHDDITTWSPHRLNSYIKIIFYNTMMKIVFYVWHLCRLYSTYDVTISSSVYTLHMISLSVYIL